MQLRRNFFNDIIVDKIGQYAYHLPSTNFTSVNLKKNK